MLKTTYVELGIHSFALEAFLFSENDYFFSMHSANCLKSPKLFQNKLYK